MKNVAVALYAEGPTDQLFLPEVIRRTAKQILNQSGQQYIDVKPVDPISFSKIGMKQEDVCRCMLPIVPVQMTEAWMLADPEALRAALGTSKNAQELGLPSKAKLVETDTDPKRTLKMIVSKVNTHRSRLRRLEVTTLYTLLGRTVDISRLNHVPAYQRFVQDLVNAFRTINLID